MKLPFKRYIPHTLAFMLIASSPLSVLSTTAYATSLEQVTQEQNLQEPLQGQMTGNTNVTEETVTPIETVTVSTDATIPAPNNADNTKEQTSSLEVTEPSTPPTENAGDDVSTEPTTTQPTNNTGDESGTEAPTDETSEDEEQPTTETPSTMDSRFEEAKKAMNDAKTYEEKRQLVDKAFEAFRKEQTKENLQLAVDYTVLLPYSSENFNKGDKAYYRDNLYPLFDFLNQKDKDEVLYHFADASIKQTWITFNRNDMEIAKMAHDLLPEGAKKDANKIELDKVVKKVYEVHTDPDTGYVDWDDPNIEYGEPPTKDDSDGNWEPGFDPDDYDFPSNSQQPDNFEEGTAVIDYSTENGTCYKTTTYYNTNGLFVKRTKDVAKADEKTFCTIDIPAPNAQDYYNDGWEKDMTGNIDGSPDGSVNPEDLPNAEATLTTDTIQYTFEKDNDSPYYYDTGIHVSKENTLTYQQARDALYQISIQAKGKFVEDNDRALALLDGLIILVEDKEKPIAVEEFISLFKDTSIGVKAQGTRSGDTYELVDLIEIKTVSTVLVNGKKIELEANPIVDDGTVLFPIEKIAKSLNGTVSTTENSTTVEYKGNRITFTDNQLSVKENGKDKELSSPTRQNQNGVRMAEVKVLLDFFHSTIEVHSDSNEVIITTE